MRKIIIVVSVMGLLLFGGLLLLFFNPGNQMRFYVRENAYYPNSKMARAAGRFITPYFELGAKPMPASMLNALCDLLSDPDPKIREAAFEHLFYASRQPGNEAKIFAIPGIQEKLKTLVNDLDSVVAYDSIAFLGCMENKDNIPFFRNVLKRYASKEDLCAATLRALSVTHDPGTLEDILPFVHDSRQYLVTVAIEDISDYEDQRVLDVIAENLPLTDHFHASTYAMVRFRALFPKHDISVQMDPALLAACRNTAIENYERVHTAQLISDKQMRIQAWESILLSPGPGHHSGGQIDAAVALGKMKSNAASAIPSLEKILNDPGTDSAVRKEVEKALKEIRQ